MNSKINIIYNILSNFRENYFKIESLLKNDFYAPAISPARDYDPVDLPRLIATTKYGHSIFNMALNNSFLATNFDSKFSSDWKLCKEYIYNKYVLINNFLNKFPDFKANFQGIMLTVIFDKLPSMAFEIIKNNFFNDAYNKISNPFDAACKFAYIIDNKYYINFTIEKNFSIDINNDRNCIVVSIDINDRYMYQKNNSYISKVDTFNTLLDITNVIINNKLSNLILKGEFNINDLL